MTRVGKTNRIVNNVARSVNYKNTEETKTITTEERRNFRTKYSNKLIDDLHSFGYIASMCETTDQIEISIEKNHRFWVELEVYFSGYGDKAIPHKGKIIFHSPEYKLKLRTWLFVKVSEDKTELIWDYKTLGKKLNEVKIAVSQFYATKEVKIENSDKARKFILKSFPGYSIITENTERYVMIYSLRPVKTPKYDYEVQVDIYPSDPEKIHFRGIRIISPSSMPLDPEVILNFVDLTGFLGSKTRNIGKKKESVKTSKHSIQDAVLGLLANPAWQEISYAGIADHIRTQFNSKTTKAGIAWYYAKYKDSKNLLPRKNGK